MGKQMTFDWKHPGPGLYVCECSPRGDYRLEARLVSYRSNKDTFTLWEGTVEWPSGGFEWICVKNDLEKVKQEAEAWAKEYEAQE